MLVAGLGLLARPAAAQVTVGSPGDPPHLALGLGAFDVTPASNLKRGGTAAEGRAEYRFGDVLGPIAPFIGVSGTSDSAFYGYGGVGFFTTLSPGKGGGPHGGGRGFSPRAGAQLSLVGWVAPRRPARFSPPG